MRRSRPYIATSTSKVCPSSARAKVASSYGSGCRCSTDGRRLGALVRAAVEDRHVATAVDELAHDRDAGRSGPADDEDALGRAHAGERYGDRRAGGVADSPGLSRGGSSRTGRAEQQAKRTCRKDRAERIVPKGSSWRSTVPQSTSPVAVRGGHGCGAGHRQARSPRRTPGSAPTSRCATVEVRDDHCRGDGGAAVAPCTCLLDVRDADGVAALADTGRRGAGRRRRAGEQRRRGFVSPLLDIRPKGITSLVDENFTSVVHCVRRSCLHERRRLDHQRHVDRGVPRRPGLRGVRGDEGGGRAAHPDAGARARRPRASG